MFGYLFILPWIAGLVVFVAGPMIACFLLSFTEYDILSPAKWVGVQNYVTAFTDDELFWPSLGRTFYYAGVVIPLEVAGSLLLAMLLNHGLRGTNIFRTMFFLPHLAPAVAMGLLWAWLLNPEIGPMNFYLSKLGFPRNFPWLTARETVVPSLIFMSLWSEVGGNRMLIFLASLQGVPEELYEVADIDGAGRIAKLLHVTLPMISPAIFFNLVLGIIGALQVFALAWVTTKGGPFYGSWFIALHIYQQSFSYFRMGYGSALSWVFVVIVMILTLINVKLSNRWVFYGGV